MYRRSIFLCSCFAIFGWAMSPAMAHEPGPHVHGVASLQVAVDGNTLTLNLESPLDNVLGFEHAPRSEKQKAAVRSMDECNKPSGVQHVS